MGNASCVPDTKNGVFLPLRRGIAQLGSCADVKSPDEISSAPRPLPSASRLRATDRAGGGSIPLGRLSLVYLIRFGTMVKGGHISAA
jgi:hypothetical protein